MFLERLSLISKRIGSTLALCLVGRDGIPVETFRTDPDIDIEVLAAEMTLQVRSIVESYDELEAGPLSHYTLTTDQLTLMVSSVANGYYLLLVLGPEGNLGRARFELRRAQLTLAEDLA